MNTAEYGIYDDKLCWNYHTTLVLQCCQNYQPVLHNFFLEGFPHPSEWFEARTRYTRSTAVASMAGAVIGLGDRHMGNILLDMHTAEVGAGMCYRAGPAGIIP